MRDITIEDVEILPGSWRNFRGEEKKFNAKGQRNFNIALSKDTAERMAAEGWNIKMRDPREEGDDPLYYLQVTVNYGGRPPKIVMITSNGQTRLDEDTVGELDNAVIIKADLILHPYEWEVNGNTGVKAYCNTLFVHIEENDLEKKYGKFDSIEPQNGPDDAPPWDE